MLENKQNDVFLSYVKENRGIIKFVDQTLTDYGLNVITDYKNIDVGQNWERKIENLIKNSGYIIFCFSKEFNDKERTVMFREIQHAIRNSQDISPDKEYIIPVRINECEIPDIEIRVNESLRHLQYIDLFPGFKLHEGIESIVKVIDRELIENPQNSIAEPLEIESLKKIGFKMRSYSCNEAGDLKFKFRREYWSLSDWLIISSETPTKLANYITAIVSGTREGILSEICLSLTINQHRYKDVAYNFLIEKAKELCQELYKSNLPDTLIEDIIEVKNSFTIDKILNAHTIYTDTNYSLKGINVNMHNDVSNQSTLDEKPIRFRFYITKFSFTY